MGLSLGLLVLRTAVDLLARHRLRRGYQSQQSAVAEGVSYHGDVRLSDVDLESLEVLAEEVKVADGGLVEVGGE